jgi:hypothetical protein
MSDFFYIKVFKLYCTITVLLNGVPIIVDEGVGEYQATLPVQQWLKSQNNVLKVSLSRPRVTEGTPHDQKAKSSGQADLVFFKHQAGAASSTVGELISEFHWTDSPGFLPHSWSEPIRRQFPELPASTLWSRAEVLNSLTAFDKESIFTAASQLAALLSAHRLDDAFSLMQVKYQDEATLEGKSLERVASAVKELWAMMLDQGVLKLELINLSQLEFTIVGDNRAVFVRKVNGNPVILFEEPVEEMFYGIPLYFCKINGNWVIIR